MSMFTIRFNVLDAAPLDGSTPLDLSPGSGVIVDHGQGPLRITEVTIPVGSAFGLFDPGEVVERENVTWSLTSFIAISQAAYGAGDEVRLVSPLLPGGGAAKELPFIDMSVNDGFEPFSPQLVQVDHKLAFDTTGTGAAGPHLIQLLFATAQQPGQLALMAGASSAYTQGRGDSGGI